MGEKVAASALAGGITAFGVSLADLGQMATIFAGFMGGLASLAAFFYYLHKMKRGK